MNKVIITGASSGLGFETARLLVKKKVSVINVSRTKSELDLINILTDLTKNSNIKQTLDVINKNHQDADTLILCAGVLHRHTVGTHPIEEVDDDFSVNVLGAIKLVEGIIDIIKKNKGDIVLIGSTSSFNGAEDSSVYVSAKHAVLGYVKSLQVALKKENVRVIGFHPGGFQSQFHIKAGSPLKQEDLMDAKELAKLIVTFLELPRNMEVSEIIINRKNVK